MEEQVRWNQKSLQAAEGGFGVAEHLLLGHQHIHRTQLAKQGPSREGAVLGQPQCSWDPSGAGTSLGNSLGATRRTVLILEAELQEGVCIGTASPLRKC